MAVRCKLTGVQRGASAWSLVLMASLTCSCAGSARTPLPGAPAEVREAARAGGASSASNVLRADYVGSEACQGCHPDVYDAWRRSPMHRMTREQSGTEVSAPFDGRSLELGGDVATLELREGRRFVSVSHAGQRSLYRVTKLIGGRYREDFVGEEVDLDAPLGKALAEQRVLPLSFLKFDGSLRYKGYSVMVPERHGLEPGLVWQRACVLCHNTAPQLLGLYDELHGEGAPSYQGSASNELPSERAFRYSIDDAAALRAELSRELRLLGDSRTLPNDPRQALEVAISGTRERFSEAALVELGVGCESCHGGAREHAEAPQRVRPSFGLKSPLLHVETAAGGVPTPAQDVNRTCAKCHTVLFSQYPFTWEGGERRAHPGGSTTNSGEARDFLLGGCSSSLSCTACHDPHGEDSKARLEELGTVRGNGVCTSCHARYADTAALGRHSHHLPTGPGSACSSCHMPKKNMGLAYELTRYHRIGSPTDAARVLGDRPLDCALCHADRSVGEIVRTMEKWWGKSYDRAKLARLYGADERVNALRVTLFAGKPHEQVVAADAAVRQNLAATSDAIVALLDNPYPLVRYFARHQLERRFGAAFPGDMNASGPSRLRAARAWVASFENAAP